MHIRITQAAAAAVEASDARIELQFSIPTLENFVQLCYNNNNSRKSIVETLSTINGVVFSRQTA